MRSTTKQRQRKRGTVVYEATIALLLAVAVIAGAAKVMLVVSKQRRVLDLRSVARREAGNLMEEVMSRPWNELANDAEPAAELSTTGTKRLPNAQATVEVTTNETAPESKRISVRVTWGRVEDKATGSFRLVAWRYRPQESQP